MFIDEKDFNVIFSDYAKKHFCKDFLKKYHSKKWRKTEDSIKESLRLVAGFVGRETLDKIQYNDEEKVGLFKFDFAVAGERQSPKKSGNRLFFFLDNSEHEIEILLVYGKTHLPKRDKETVWAMKHLGQNFKNYWDRLY